MVEIDVTRSRDGEFFVFHPGMEPVFLNCGKYIPEMTAAEVRELPLLNQDRTPTHYRVPTLQEVFALLRGRAYINVDKFWTDVPGITQEIRKAGVEQQVIVKTPVEEEAPQGPLFCGEGRVHIRKKAHRGQRCIYGVEKATNFIKTIASRPEMVYIGGGKKLFYGRRADGDPIFLDL